MQTIPNLTPTGELPIGRYSCSQRDVYEQFVSRFSSTRRQAIFEEWKAYNERLLLALKVPKLVQWLDGSFITSKQNPNDLDLVTFVPISHYTSGVDWLIDYYSTVSLHDKGLDAFMCPVYPTNHDDYSTYLGYRDYWQHLFGHSKNNTDEKGFLEVVITQ